MTEVTDIQRLHVRIDEVIEKFGTVTEKLTALHTDVKVIKEAGRQRDLACVNHTQRTDMLDVSMRGEEGVFVRLNAVEQKSSAKEKFAYLTIGALSAGIVSLSVALLIKLTS